MGSIPLGVLRISPAAMDNGGGDDPNYTEPIVLLYLGQMIIPDEATAIKVVSLPFLDTIEWGDSDVMEFWPKYHRLIPQGYWSC